MASTWDSLWPVIVGAIAQRALGTGSGDTPNVYPIALTPEQKRVEDEKWNVYKGGGSDTQKAVRAAVQNFLSNPQTPKFEFVSDELRGQPFAGGLTLPKFNFTSMLGNAVTPPGMPKPDNADIRTGKPTLPDVAPNTTRSDFGDESGFPTPDPDALRRSMENLSPADEGNLSAAWASYRQQHPDWVRNGTAAAAGFLGTITGLSPTVVLAFLRKWIGTSPDSPLGGGPYPSGGPAINRDIPTNGMPVDPNYSAPWPSLGATAPVPFTDFVGGLQNFRAPAGAGSFDNGWMTAAAGRKQGMY